MKKYWLRFKKALAISKWPILTPAELRLAEQKKILERLFGKKQ